MVYFTAIFYRVILLDGRLRDNLPFLLYTFVHVYIKGGVTPTPNINAYTKGTLCKRPIARADYIPRQLIRAI